jgi:murein DD-endopeptidase MepM/ murein hydrolase activator NlpD
VSRKSAIRYMSACGLCIVLTACGTDVARVPDKFPNPFAGSARFDPPTTGSLSSERSGEGTTNEVVVQPKGSGAGAISSSSLAPVPGAGAIATSKVSSGTPTELKKVASLSPAPSLTAPQSTNIGSATGSWTAQGGSSVILKSGETLSTLSSRYGVPEVEIRRVNGFSKRTHLAAGTKVVIPVYVSGAPTAAVKDKGQAAKPVTATLATPTGVNPDTKSKSQATSAKSGVSKPAQVADLEPAAPADAALPEDNAKQSPAIGFRWPARGRVIQAFGDKDGVKNTGINISLPQGTPVKAAEAGTVAYAGSEVKGFGNLVMIRHADGWVSVYANASEIKVKRGDEIKRGQVIALSGQSGDVAAPQLHFELRKGSVPVDPVGHLSDD